MGRQMSPQSSEYDAVLMAAFPFQGYIAATEHRAITLTQLRRIVDFVKCSCSAWTDLGLAEPTGILEMRLSFTSLNLYHVDAWLIRPATRADNCSFTELLTSERQIPAWYVGHYWGDFII